MMGFFYKKPDFDKLRQNRDEKKLIRLLYSRNPRFREEAARLLGEINTQSSIEELVKSLMDDNSGVRTAVAQSLTAMKWRPTTSMERISWFFACGNPVNAIELQDSDIPILINLLFSAKLESVRILSAQTLGYKYNDEVIEALIRALVLGEFGTESGAKIAQAAEDALVRIGNPAVPMLQEVISTNTVKLAQRLFEAQLSLPTMPMPVFAPRITLSDLLPPTERLKQRVEKIVKTILSSS